MAGDSDRPHQDQIGHSNAHWPTLNASDKCIVVQNPKGQMINGGHAFAQQIGRAYTPVGPERIIE
jgi:hypothetical protein